jgi:glycosyltransferase involved in cell wall biosynthesis
VTVYDGILIYAHSHYRASLPIVENGDDQLGDWVDKNAKRVRNYVQRSSSFPFVQFKRASFGGLARLPFFTLCWLWARARDYRKRYAPVLARIGDYAITKEMVETYRRVDADIYCSFGVGNATADIIAYCRRWGKKFVLFAGSGDDFSDSYRKDSLEHNVYGSRCDVCYDVVMTADYIVTQTEDQRRLLKQRFGRNSACIANPFDLCTPPAMAPISAGRFALWIGKSDPVKQPLLFIELAQANPDLSFMMIMNRSDQALHAEVLSRRPPNVMLVESVPFHQIERYFAQAYVLVNTSRFEGFPNTFLQAGKYAVPVLSLAVDPDGFIELHECGFVAKGDSDALNRGLRTLARDCALRSKTGANLRTYVEERHALPGRVDELKRFLNTVADDA